MLFFSDAFVSPLLWPQGHKESFYLTSAPNLPALTTSWQEQQIVESFDPRSIFQPWCQNFVSIKAKCATLIINHKLVVFLSASVAYSYLHSYAREYG